MTPIHRYIFVVFFLLVTPVCAFAQIHTETVEYKDEDIVLEGYLAYDESSSRRRPAVLVIHEWTGIGPYVRGRVEQLAKLGYIAFAADIYGKGIRPGNPEDAGKEAGKYKNNRPLLRRRVLAGLDVIKNHKLTDSGRIAAIGYCFGGTTILELARSGADIKGVVSFHGGLNTLTPDDAKNIKAKVLVLHGADDPYVPISEVTAFEEEMRKGDVDWQLISYGNTVHSFTNSKAGNDPSKGAAYNKKSDERSFQAMIVFFNEIFK